MRRKLRLGIWISAVALLTAGIVSCVVQKSPVTGKKRAYGYSWEEEVKIGREADQQIQQQYGLYRDEALNEYVSQVSREILSVSHMRREDALRKYRETEFHFRVLNSPVINAFALPGGYVYVTRGLLSHLNNEAQLAVVIGHEIGHVAARHASQRAFEQKVGQIALVGGAIAGQELLGVPGQDLLNLGGTAAQFLFLKYGRDDERESDRLGVEYAAKTRYRAAEGAEFFSVLERKAEESDQDIPSFLSTHPDPEERESSIPRLAENWREEGYEQTILDKEQYLERIDGIIYGNNPREGFTRDGSFYHPELEFQFSYPDTWTLINQATQVAIVNENRDAVMIMRIDSESDSPRASVMEFINREGITLLSQSAADSRGLPAYEATAEAQARDGTVINFYVYGVEFRENIYRFISYTASERFSTYRPAFINTTNSFSALTDQDILNIQPVKLQIVTTERSGKFETFIPDKLPMDITPDEVALINQLYLDDTVESGSLIKIPVQENP